MNAMQCLECKLGRMLPRVPKHVENVGGQRVVDGTVQVLMCEGCGSYDLTAAQLAGYERRAAALVLRDGRHVHGAVIKYARKALGLRQAELAELLGFDVATVSRWETEARPMARAEQLALVALLDAAERGQEITTPIDAPEPAELEVLPEPRRVAC